MSVESPVGAGADDDVTLPSMCEDRIPGIALPPESPSLLDGESTPSARPKKRKPRRDAGASSIPRSPRERPIQPVERQDGATADRLFNRVPVNAITAPYWANTSALFFSGVTPGCIAVVDRFRAAAVADSLCLMESMDAMNPDSLRCCAHALVSPLAARARAQSPALSMTRAQMKSPEAISSTVDAAESGMSCASAPLVPVLLLADERGVGDSGSVPNDEALPTTLASVRVIAPSGAAESLCSPDGLPVLAEASPAPLLQPPMPGELVPKRRGRPPGAQSNKAALDPFAVQSQSIDHERVQRPLRLVVSSGRGEPSARVTQALVVAGAFGVAAHDLRLAAALAGASAQPNSSPYFCATPTPAPLRSSPSALSTGTTALDADAFAIDGGTADADADGPREAVLDLASLAGSDAVQSALALALRQQAVLCARNSARLHGLLQSLELEHSLQTLYAQLGRPLPVAPGDDVEGEDAADDVFAASARRGLPIRSQEWDASGLPLRPCTSPVPPPGSLACEAALHETYWSLAGPRCDLRLDEKVAAARAAETTWRFGGAPPPSNTALPSDGLVVLTSRAVAGSANRPHVGMKGPYQAAGQSAQGNPQTTSSTAALCAVSACEYPGATAQAGFTSSHLLEREDPWQAPIAADAYARRPPRPCYLPREIDASEAPETGGVTPPRPTLFDAEDEGMLPSDLTAFAPPPSEIDTGRPRSGSGDAGPLPVSASRRGRRGGRGGRRATRGVSGRFSQHPARLAGIGISSLDDDDGMSSGGPLWSSVAAEPTPDDDGAPASPTDVAAAEAAAEAAATRERLGRALERTPLTPFPAAPILFAAVSAPCITWDCAGASDPRSQQQQQQPSPETPDGAWEFPEHVHWVGATEEPSEAEMDAVSDVRLDGVSAETSLRRGALMRAALTASAALFSPSLLHQPGLRGGAEGATGAGERRQAAFGTLPVLPAVISRSHASAPLRRRPAAPWSASTASAGVSAVPSPGAVNSEYCPPQLLGLAAAAPYLDEVRRLLSLGAPAGAPRDRRGGRRGGSSKGGRGGASARGSPSFDSGSGFGDAEGGDGYAHAPALPTKRRRSKAGRALRDSGEDASAAAAQASLDDSHANSLAAAAPSPPAPARSLAEAQSDIRAFLSAVPLGTVVEARDSSGQWYVAVVVADARDAGTLRRYVRVRYAGWDSCVDDWTSVEAVPPTVVPLGTHLRRAPTPPTGRSRF